MLRDLEPVVVSPCASVSCTAGHGSCAVGIYYAGSDLHALSCLDTVYIISPLYKDEANFLSKLIPLVSNNLGSRILG